MGVWDQDNYIKAWNFASKVHNGQVVLGTEIPYINHIGLVAMEAMAALFYSNAINLPDLLILCAILHDAIEDTKTTYDEIQDIFGTNVANGVQALSKNTTLSSKEEQMRDSIERIKRQPKEIWMVKLSDRITNLQPPPKNWNKIKISAYKNEAILILKQLGESNNYLLERLKAKIDAYQQYE